MNPTRGYNSPGMMLRLRHHPSGRLPTSRLVEKALVPDHWFMTGPSYRPRQQLRDVLLQAVVRLDADGILHAPLLQGLVDLRLGMSVIGSKHHFFAEFLLALNLRQQQLLPVLGTVHIIRPQFGRQKATLSVE